MPAFALALQVLMVAPAMAQTSTWTGAIDNDWNKAGNWTGGVPTHNAHILSGFGTVLIAATDPSITGDLVLGAPGMTILLSGSLTQAATGRVGIGASAIAKMTVIGAGSALTANANASENQIGQIDIGTSAGPGELQASRISIS